MQENDIFAFPASPGDDYDPKDVPHGMTLRDWFAGQVASGLPVDWSYRKGRCRHAAEMAYRMADALLEARSK